MKTTNTTQIKFKSGVIVPVGTACEIKFNGENTTSEVIVSGVSYKIKCANLPYYFSKFKRPSIASLEKWSNDGVCKSMLGKRVEPDGYDDEGSPSWLLVMGMI